MNMNITRKIWQVISFLSTLVLLCGLQTAYADYVGEVQTTKYLDKQTVDMLNQRYQSGQGGFVQGDEISYIIQFTPTNNGGNVGGGGYVTDYIPNGTEVVNAQFVTLNSDGTFTQIAPPSPAAVKAGYVPMYSETGIFYSTDPRTAAYTNPASQTITPANGYPAAGGMTTHNYWDNRMWFTYAAAARVNQAGCPAVPLLALGSGPVSGADTYLKNDYSGSQGPWQRISYPGSRMGTLTGVPGVTANSCIGGTPTSAGWNLSSANPLPAGTNAVRFSAGKVTVGQLFSVRITLRLTQPIGINGLINNTEVFGGDASLDPGSNAGKDNMWKYHLPSVANSDINLTVVKSVVGMCVGAACVPTTFSGGAVPAGVANVKLRYRVTYLNSSGGPQNNVVLSDVLPAGGALVAGSEQIISGLDIRPTSPAVGGFQFQNIPTLGSGAGGVVEFDVLFAAAMVANSIKSNTAKLVSASLPGGVTSVATVTATSTANLQVSKTTSTATRTTVAPSNVASYTITIPNNGAAAASTVSIVDTLPGAGGATVNDRFAFQIGSAVASVTTSAGITTPVTITTGSVVPAPAPYVGQNREQVTFTPAVGTTIPSGGYMTLTFNATVGANVPASTTPYLNDVTVKYAGGFAVGATAQANGVAPVTVIVPLTFTKGIECVYTGLVCNTYTNGPIPTNSKIRYRLNYNNTSGAVLTGVTLTDTLPLNTTYLVGTAKQNGIAIADPTVVGQVHTFGAVNTIATGASGNVTFDVQLGTALQIPSGSNITNNAKITSAEYPGGVQASLTTSVRDAANLAISKLTTTPTIAPNGTATYQITVTNTGSIAATAVSIYDFLPFAGTVANASLRFNYLGTTSVIHTPSGGAPVALVVTPTNTIGAANVAPHNSNLNQQQVLWNFAAALPTGLGAGGQLVITFTAQPFATPATTTALPTSNTTSYYNDIQATYTSLGSGTLNNSVNATAPVKIPVILSLAKSIDCVWNAPLTSCDAYTSGMSIPANAKVRYQLSYQNLSSTLTQTNVVLSDILPVQTAAGSVSLVTLVSGTTPPTSVITPAAPAAGGTFAFATIPTLAPLASGVVKFDVLTTAAIGAPAVTNTAKIISAQDSVGMTSAATHSVPVSLSITKTIDCIGVGCISGSYIPGSGIPPNSSIRYKLTYQNIGTTAQTNVVVSDTLPAQTAAGSVSAVTLVSGTTPPTTTITPAAPAAGGTFSFATIPALAAGASGAVAFNVLTNAAAGVTVTNTGKIVSTEDSVGLTSAVSVGVTSLTVAKIISCVYSGATCTAGSYVAGTVIPPNAKIKYQVTYTNPSAAAIAGVTICDQLPTQNSGVFATTMSAFTSAPTALIAPAAFATAAQNTTCGLTGATNIAYAPISIPAASSNVLTYDVKTTAVSGNTATNTAKLVAGGLALSSTVPANVGVPNLTISKSTSTPSLSAGGLASYTVTVTNNGNAPTTSLKVYDFLPYSGTVSDATKRFTYGATTGYTGGLPVPTITTSVAPTIVPYSSNVNQQQVLWNFGAYALSAGATVTITFTATVGSAMPVTTYGNSAMYEYTSLAGAGSGNINATALVTITNATPSLMFLKTVAIISDPFNGSSNPKFIPGAVVQYTLRVINSGTGAVDNNTMAITDPIPANTALFVNDIGGTPAGPVSFTQGTPSSTLTYTSPADVQFSNTILPAVPVWGYVPVAGADGCDPLVTHIKFNPKGTFVGNPTPPSPSFDLNFRVCVK